MCHGDPRLNPANRPGPPTHMPPRPPRVRAPKPALLEEWRDGEPPEPEPFNHHA